MLGSSLSNEQEGEMIATAISITKYENEAALEERREERWMTMMMTIMIVLRKQLAHITRGKRPRRCLPFGKDSINPEKNQISGETERGRGGSARWQGSHFPLLSFANHLPPPSPPLSPPPFVTDGLKSNDGFLPSFPFFAWWRRRRSFFRVILLLCSPFLLGSPLPTALTIRDCFFSFSASFGEIGV